MPIHKIVSGGQTGVDRAALDWAITRGIEHGGWCPDARRAEDGVIPDVYSLQQTPEQTTISAPDGTCATAMPR